MSEDLNTDDWQAFGESILKKSKLEKETKELEQKKKQEEFVKTIEELEILKEQNTKLSEMVDVYSSQFIQGAPAVQWRPLGIEQAAKTYRFICDTLAKRAAFIIKNQNPTRRITATTLPIKYIEVCALTESKKCFENRFSNLMPVIRELVTEQEKRSRGSVGRKRVSRKKKILNNSTTTV